MHVPGSTESELSVGGVKKRRVSATSSVPDIMHVGGGGDADTANLSEGTSR